PRRRRRRRFDRRRRQGPRPGPDRLARVPRDHRQGALEGPLPVMPGHDGLIFGIRHHGPGSARSVVAALDETAPDCVLVEGPPDADALIPLVTDPAMQPPVAILV